MSPTYAEYYRDCRVAWHRSADGPSVYGLGIHPIHPHAPRSGDLVSLANDYADTIAVLAADVSSRIDSGTGLFCNPDSQVSAIASQLDDVWDLAGLEPLAAMLVPQLEASVLGCRAVVNQVNVIRSLPSPSPPVSSWLWHYDNNAAEAFKVLIYLTEVTPGRGAFEYLEGPEPGQFRKVETSRLSPTLVGPPRWPGSRIPNEAIERWLAEGVEARTLLGPPGTMVVFDNNCVHRATIPNGGHRDAIILSLRPVIERVRPFIARTHTGSWDYNAKAWHPHQLQPHPLPSDMSGRRRRAA